MCHGEVCDVLQCLRICALADEHVEFFGGCPQPEAGNEDGEDDGAHGIDPPSQFATAERGENTEAVDGEVVSVVLPEDLDLGVLMSYAVAVEEEAEFRAEGDCDCND